MEVILLKDVEKLGYKDDLVKVKNGYGRNFLVPKGLAVMATPPLKKMHDETLRQRAHKQEKVLEDANKIAKKLEGTTIKVGAKAGEKGKIFGSVNNLQVADAIKEMGISIDKSDVTITGDTIKTVGEYTAEVKLHRDVKVTVNFEVVAE